MEKIISQKKKEFVLKKSSRLMYMLGFLIPLYSLSIRFFIEWSWYKLIPFIFLVIIFTKRRRKCLPRKDIFQLAAVLISYMLVITLYNYFLNIESGRFFYAVEAGQYYLRTYGHMIVQFVVIVAALLQFFFSPYLIKSKKDVDAFVNGFIGGNIISVMFGVIQYAAYRLNMRYEWLNIVGSPFRMSGLGGEPRHFGAFLLLALLILIANYLSNRSITIKNTLGKGGILAGGLFFSLSTSAWLGFLGGISMLFLFTFKLRRTLQIIAISFALIALLIFSNNFMQIVNDRFLTRMESLDYLLYFAPKDGIVLKLISNNLRVCLLGTGSGGSDFYVMNYSFLDSVPDVILRAGIIRSVYEGKVSNSLSPSSFFIKYWVEYGVIGIILLLMFAGLVIRKIRTTLYNRFVLLTSVSVLVASIPSSMLFVYVYFSLLSLLYGFYYQKSLMAGIQDSEVN
jgi:hypothetical protein